MANTWKLALPSSCSHFGNECSGGFGFPLMHVIQVHLKRHHSAMVRWNSEWPSQLAKMLQNEILLLKKIFKSYQTVLMAQCCGSFRIGKSFQEWTFMQVYESWIIFCPQMYVVEGQKKILHSVENMPIIDHAWTMAVATRQMSTVLDLFCPSFLATMATEAWRG